MNDLVVIVRDAAARHGLDPAVACGLVTVESAWSPWAARYEGAFFARYIDKSSIHIVVQEFCRNARFHITFDTELRERATSRGLWQMMGQVARERGYVEPIAKLHEPATASEWGARHLRKLLDRCAGDMSLALLRWNGGGDPTYSERVFKAAQNYAT